MALMKFKNKYDVAFKQMVLDAKKIDGIPKEIEVDPMEMWGVINEMRWSEIPDSRFSVLGGDEFTRRRTFWSAYEDMPKDEANKVIREIMREEYTVQYDDIPLRVIIPPKKPKEDVPDKNIKAPEFETVPRPMTPEELEAKFTNPAIPQPTPVTRGTWWKFWK